MRPGALEIQEETEGQRRTIALVGELDLVTADSLERAVAAAIQSRPRELILDLRRLEFVDSTGFRVLLAAKEGCRDAGVDFAMTRGPEHVQRLFDLSGVLKRLRFV